MGIYESGRDLRKSQRTLNLEMLLGFTKRDGHLHYRDIDHTISSSLFDERSVMCELTTFGGMFIRT